MSIIDGGNSNILNVFMLAGINVFYLGVTVFLFYFFSD